MGQKWDDVGTKHHQLCYIMVLRKNMNIEKISETIQGFFYYYEKVKR